MLEIARSRITARARRLVPARLIGFAERQDGAAAVEFALVAVPFLALLFAILETALVFFATQSLEATVADTARLIMTGQAQTSVSPSSTATPPAVGYTQADFKNAACARLSGLFSCSNLYVSVTSSADYSSANASTPLDSTGKVTYDVANLPYNPGTPGSIVVVQLYYQWPIIVSLLNEGLADVAGTGKRLLVATAVFRNEPYQ